MINLAVTTLVFICLAAASLGAMLIWRVLPERHRGEDTTTVVRLLANIFVVMTSLVFGLMINSAKNTYSTIDENVHSFGTNLILLDRTLRAYGPAGEAARAKLVDYMETAIERPARADDVTLAKPDPAGQALVSLGETLAAIQPADAYEEAMLADARQQYRRVFEQRWGIVEQSEGAIPAPLIIMLIAWLMLVFGSFGYRAPGNVVTVASFVLSAGLIAGAFYLVLDMDVPFSGPIHISDAPLRRALAEMKM